MSIKKKDITNNSDKITIFFASNRKEYMCPNCNTTSTEVTTYFHRVIQDLPIINKALLLNIRLKKFRCNNNNCTTKVFSESIDELALTKQRKTNRLSDHLTSFALTNSAEGAAKLLRSYHNIHVSGDTLLRLAKSVTFEVNTNEIDAIGIDDFALKKHRYGTIFVDLKTNKVIDIIGGRNTDDVFEVLKKFPNLKIISRDRGAQYKNIQGNYTHIADRFHLLMNLSDTMIDEIKKSMPREIRLEIRECDNANALPTVPHNTSKVNLNHKQMEKLGLVLEIKEKPVQGLPLRQLAREYNLSRATVKKYVKMITPQEEVKYDTSNSRIQPI